MTFKEEKEEDCIKRRLEWEWAQWDKAFKVFLPIALVIWIVEVWLLLQA